jgi:hypothetical protein
LLKLHPERNAFGCGSHLDKRPKGLFCKRLLLGRYILLNINIKIFKTVLLPVVLCRCGSWWLTFSEEVTISVSENRALRGIFGFKR